MRTECAAVQSSSPRRSRRRPCSRRGRSLVGTVLPVMVVDMLVDFDRLLHVRAPEGRDRAVVIEQGAARAVGMDARDHLPGQALRPGPGFRFPRRVASPVAPPGKLAAARWVLTALMNHVADRIGEPGMSDP